MSQRILAEGPPPLTEDAADAALHVIDFIAAEVRGYDAIDVTAVVLPIWRFHLAHYYPYLAPGARLWYANAANLGATINAYWPSMNQWERQPFLQQWAAELPYMLAIVDPVLAEAQAVEMEQAQRTQLQYWRQQAHALPTQDDMQANAIDALNRKSQMTTTFQNYSTAMANSTIDLMRAINRRS